MTKEEIKKALYKQNPVANLIFIRKGVVYYEAPILDYGDVSRSICFEVPVSDMGDADFLAKMQAKHLIRYIA
jgi:hypothetical protein